MVQTPRKAGPERRVRLAEVMLLAALLAFGGTAAVADDKAPPAEGTIAHIRLSGFVHESPPEFILLDDPDRMRLSGWLRRLARARNDANVKAVALEIGTPQLTWAQAQELADAVRRLDRVKPVYTYFGQGGFAQFLIASAGRELAMEPSSELGLVGLGAELLFFRGVLNRLHLEPQMIQIGRFKGSAESLTDTKPSQEMLDSLNGILDDLYGQFCGAIAAQRGIDLATVKKTIDRGPIPAPAALEAGFVDKLVEKLDWREHVQASLAPGKDVPDQWVARYGQSPRTEGDLSSPFAMLNLLLGMGKTDPIRDPTIAVIHADGIIVSGLSGDGMLGQKLAGARTLIRCFREVADDDRIKAAVLRIDSPGGSALASEWIYQAVRKCAAKKPVIVSISQTGASGGYYIAVGAKTIFADPAAVVGSIGVVSGKIATAGLLDWIGITRHELTRGRNAGLWMSRAWNEREKAVIRRLAQRTYDTFLRRVAQSRAGKIKDIGRVAEGRIFTGRQAVANGLIDAEGGLNDAIEAAKETAGLDAAHYLMLPRPRTLFDLLSGREAALRPFAQSWQQTMLARAGASSTGVAYLVNLARLFSRESVLAAVPYYFGLQAPSR